MEIQFNGLAMPEGSGQKHRDNTLMQMGLLGMACHKNKSSLSPKAAKNLTHDGYFLHLTVSVETTDLKPRNGSMVTKKLILMLILTQLHIVNILNWSILCHVIFNYLNKMFTINCTKMASDFSQHI